MKFQQILAGTYVLITNINKINKYNDRVCVVKVYLATYKSI